ncbi:MAG TPA: hypothetical protein PKY59_09485 [Pyrinomonadaceae bacterium]|nr:hypothetical protein [Pyrinomonadaceae bacterium]
MSFQNKRLIGIFVFVGFLLLIPFTAMRFTNEVNWSLFDFIAAGVLLLGTGLTCEMILRIVTKTSYRIAICAVVLLTLFVVWAELAVGIIGTRFAGT